MEMFLTGDALTGEEAAAKGFANRAFPAERLEDEVLAVAQRIALVPTELAQINKRSVHRAMEIMGLRAAIPLRNRASGAGVHHRGEPGLPRRLQARRHQRAGATVQTRRPFPGLPRKRLIPAGPRPESLSFGPQV